MTLYRFTIDLETRDALAKCVRAVMRYGQLGAVVTVGQEVAPSYTEVAQGELVAPPGNTKASRNAEIIAKYEAGASSVELAEAYGVSRERICQILRPLNAIARKQERRAAAKEALASAVATERARTAQLWETKIQEALALIRSGVSHRKASQAVGMGPHSTFTNIVGKRARAEGLAPSHGCHRRDFTTRKAKIKAALLAGLNLSQIVKALRSEDPKIHHRWVSDYRTQLIAAGETLPPIPTTVRHKA